MLQPATDASAPQFEETMQVDLADTGEVTGSNPVSPTARPRVQPPLPLAIEDRQGLAVAQKAEQNNQHLIRQVCISTSTFGLRRPPTWP
jgi:hypothetical protein